MTIESLVRRDDRGKKLFAVTVHSCRDEPYGTQMKLISEDRPSLYITVRVTRTYQIKLSAPTGHTVISDKLFPENRLAVQRLEMCKKRQKSTYIYIKYILIIIRDVPIIIRIANKTFLL